MPLSQEQIDYIINLDAKGKEIMHHGGEGALLMSMVDKMPELKKIMDNSTHSELDAYCEKYEGFFYYMKMLEMLAQGCKDGIFNDILEK